MSAGCVRWMLRLAVKNVCGSGGGFVYSTPASRLTLCSGGRGIVAASWRCCPYTTEGADTQPTPEPKKKKPPPLPRASGAISSVGRKIPHPKIQVISEHGEDMGVMQRADAIELMSQKDLKLVLLREKQEPPVYQLMSGKQIHEEQLKQREQKKAKTATVQVKELSFTEGIASHDHITKMKQVESWLEKKYHVRLTVRSKNREPSANVVTSLEQMLSQMETTVGFVSKPQAVRDGRAAMCVLRPLSAKELSQMKNAAKSPAAAKTSPSETSSVGSGDASEESIRDETGQK